MGGLILTPGVECEQSSTEHYSVYVAKNCQKEDDCEEVEALFSSQHVCGALFLQHHMMTYDKKQGKMVAKDRTSIKKTIEKVTNVNQIRQKMGLSSIDCMFDAEPNPVASRRYFNNPKYWPEEEREKIKQLETLLKKYKVDDFLHKEIDSNGFFPLLPSNQSLGNLFHNDKALAVEISNMIGAITGRVMANLGINVLYAPVCDLQAEAFEKRCYGKEVEQVVDLASAWVMGALSNKAIKRVCLKHAPGHGVRVNSGKKNRQDTHNTNCQTDESLEEIKKHMSVFTKVVSQLMQEGVKKSSIEVMTNHIKYLVLDSENVVSCSEKAMNFIKNSLPTGIKCVADCINMASYASCRESFKRQLKKTMFLHDAGVIATTHYVKKMSRQEMIKVCEDTDWG